VVWSRDGCADCRVKNCYFHDLGAGGVKIGTMEKPERPENLTHQVVVDNNIIRNNIFTGNMKAQLEATRIDDHLSFTFIHNMVEFSTSHCWGINGIKSV